MKIPPGIIDMKVREAGRTKCRLWLPLFILWPLLAAFVALAAVMALLADAALAVLRHRRRYTRLLLGLLEVLGETRGVRVSVEGEDRTVAFKLS